ncbi:MAG: PAS domain-containing protein [Bacteroidota bacterium]
MLSKDDHFFDDLRFEHLPLFCQFVIEHHLHDFVDQQISLATELKIPVLKGLTQLSREDMHKYATVASLEFLENLANDKAAERLAKAMEDWKTNKLQYHQNNIIEADDVFLISYMRRRIFMGLLRAYPVDAETRLKVIEDMDRYFLAQERLSTGTYFEILKSRIQEESYYKEKLVVTSPGFYYLFDMENDRQLQSSEKLFEYLGYAPGEFQDNDRFFRTLIHEEDLVTAETYLTKLRAGKDGEVHFFEYRLRDKRGQYRWMRNYESVYARNSAGVAIHSIGIAFDITKERLITEELVQREEDLLEAQELANMGSYVWNIQTGQTVTTPQALKILGLSSAWKIENLLNSVHPADVDNVKKAWAKTLTGSGEFDIECRCVVNGEEKIIWARGRVILKKKIPVLIKGTIMDVTDRHEIISKLTESEQLYSQAQAMSKLGNWTWEVASDKLYWSDELYRIYGLVPQSATFTIHQFINFIHPDDREKRWRKLREQLSDGEVRNYHFRITAIDGKEKILYGQSQALLDESGIAYKMIGTCQDVTEQKELENSLFQKTVQLERSNASLEEFAYITSHDLKEPLRKISVFGDRLLSEALSPSVAKITVVKIVECAVRMQRMVDDILSLSEVSFSHSFKKTNLGILLEDVIQNLDYMIEASGARLEYDTLPTAIVNETQFRQLFQNLISNAIKFKREDVTPVLSIRYDLLTNEEVRDHSLSPRKKYLRLVFSDNGIGFENAFAAKIFTIFQRLHSKEKFDGTGIGLAICKKIIDHHHGIISAAGEPNKGAVFTVIIPTEV